MECVSSTLFCEPPLSMMTVVLPPQPTHSNMAALVHLDGPSLPSTISSFPRHYASWTNFFLKYIYFMCTCMYLCMHKCIYAYIYECASCISHACNAYGGQKRAADPLELLLQMVLSFRVSARTRTLSLLEGKLVLLSAELPLQALVQCLEVL